jgi:hypothetical protein
MLGWRSYLQVADFPGKTDHYRMCLDIIANSPGEERPGLRAYLSGNKGLCLLDPMRSSSSCHRRGTSPTKGHPRWSA